MSKRDYTLTEAAELLGYASTSTLRAWCIQGRIDAVKRGRDWFVTSRGMAQLKEITPKRRTTPRKTT